MVDCGRRYEVALTITREAAEKVFREIVEDFGESHVGPAGAYWVGGDDAATCDKCLIGEVIFRLSPETFESMRTAYNSRILRVSDVSKLIGSGYIWFEKGSLGGLFMRLQSYQDLGKPWAEALHIEGVA